METPDKKTWKERLSRSGYFFAALLLHLIILLLVATLVIWKVQPPSNDFEFKGVTVKVPPPPIPPPAAGAAAANSRFEPQPVIVPVVTPISAITTINNSFTMDTTKVLDQALTHTSQLLPQGTGLNGLGGGNSGSGPGNGFGTLTGSSNQLTGYLYDLKQTPDRKPTGMDWVKFYQVLTEYLNRKWDDSFLDKYYKSKAPLYTNRFAISLRQSEEAPKAFNLQNEVQPALWAIHYHGKVSAPESGDYRFLGFGDNVLIVKIAGDTVLDAGWTTLLPRADLHKCFPYQWTAGYFRRPGNTQGMIKMGAVFHMDAAQVVDMDVLTGDDGGVCAFYLMIMKVGNTYETMPDGTPKAPFFQLNNDPAPVFSSKEDHPPYSTTPEPWTGVAD